MLTKAKVFTVGVLALGVILVSGCKSAPKHNNEANAAPVTDNETLVGGTGANEQFSNASGSGHNPLLSRDIYHFAYDSSDVSDEDRSRIKQHGGHIASKNKAKVRLEGHTDARGSREYNVALGHRRADSVKRELQAHGAQSNQVETISYGAERPAAHGNDDSSYEQNRRVELSYAEGAPQESGKDG